MNLAALEHLKVPIYIKLISGERSLLFGLLVFAHLSCMRAVLKCRIIVVKVSQTERYSFESLHA